jgi:hypothetical protein
LAGVAVVVAAVVAPAATGSASAVRKPYPMDVAITSTPSRTVAAGGQVIVFSGGTCQADAHPVVVELHAGAGADFENTYPVAATEARAAADGTFAVPVPLLDLSGLGEQVPLPEGDYTAVTWCFANGDYVRSEAQTITVSGTMPSQDISMTVAAYYGVVDLAGGSCPGKTVGISIEGSGSENPGDEQSAEVTATPDANGDWTYHWEGPTLGSLVIRASCGDPAADGFRYSLQYAVIVYFIPPSTTTTQPPSTTTTVDPSTTTTTGTTTTVPAAAATPVSGTAAYTG